MSGYGGADDESVNAQATIDNLIDVARMMIPKGPGSLVCLDCGDPIPLARREAQKGCLYCICCQVFRDGRPQIRNLTKML